MAAHPDLKQTSSSLRCPSARGPPTWPPVGQKIVLRRPGSRPFGDQIGSEGSPCVSEPADVVQETFLEAHRSFPRFRGSTEAEFLAWLRQVRLAKKK